MSKILIIAGTNRPGSNTAKVAAHIDAIYRAAGHPAEVLDLAGLPPEIFAATQKSPRRSDLSPKPSCKPPAFTSSRPNTTAACPVCSSTSSTC